MKARKNTAELAGTREAHLRDGAAVTQFLHWFSEHAKPGKLTEIDAAAALEHARHEAGGLKDISFPSISAAGPNAAIPHYKLTASSNRVIGRGIYLIDSGAQYEDGTTDITRTLAVGRPSAEMRDRFTRVLKGHIAIATAVFPKGTSGAPDRCPGADAAVAGRARFRPRHRPRRRRPYLSVHEGDRSASPKIGTVPLEPGMILSNEPGYYKAGAYGIRIENLIVVEPREIKGGDRTMYGFETITFAPLDRTLIDLESARCRRTGVDRRLPCAGAQEDFAARPARDAALARRRDGEAVAALTPPRRSSRASRTAAWRGARRVRPSRRAGGACLPRRCGPRPSPGCGRP